MNDAAGQENQIANNQGFWQRVIHHPAFAISGWLFGIVCMILAIFPPAETRGLLYAINPFQTQNVSNVPIGEVSVFEGVTKEKTIEYLDTTTVQVAIWNSGDLSIKTEDILKQVVIYTKPSVTIFKVKIIKEKRENDITKISLNDSQETLYKGTVPITWKILEKDDGVSIQFTYLGSDDVEIHVSGVIVGVYEIKQITEWQQFLWWRVVLILTYLLECIFAIMFGRYTVKLDLGDIFRKKFVFFSIFGLDILAIVIISYINSTLSFGPSFGFS